jgi:hypothetical protein
MHSRFISLDFVDEDPSDLTGFFYMFFYYYYRCILEERVTLFLDSVALFFIPRARSRFPGSLAPTRSMGLNGWQNASLFYPV